MDAQLFGDVQQNKYKNYFWRVEYV